MMKQMRENTKIILWIVVVAFVITIFAVWGLDLQMGGGTGGPQQNLVGRINGTPITPQLYQSVYSQLASQYRSSTPDGQLSYAQQELLREQAWESIINNMITEEQVSKLGITVTDQEILSFLRDAPPQEIRQYFVDEKGNFDYAAYRAALNNPDADWTAVEELARQRIPLIKLNQYLMAQVHVSRLEVRKEFEEGSTRMTAAYVEFPIGGEDVGDYAPSPEEVEQYYTAHPDVFRVGEQAVVRYVRIPVVPAARDREDIEYTIAQIRQDLAKDDFETLAKTYSEAPTASVGGDTGFLVRAQRPEVVMAAVDALKPGEVSGPVWTDEGVYLVKLVETQAEKGATKVRLGEIFLKLSAGSVTTDSLLTLAQEVQRAAANAGPPAGLETAAKASGLAVETSEPFGADVPIAGIGYAPSVSRFAFANEPGAVSQVIGDGQSYTVCEVAERKPAGTMPLDQVSDGIRTTLVEVRKKEQAQRKAEAFYRKLRSSPIDFEEAANMYGYTVNRTDTFTVADPIGNMPPRSPLAYAAFNVNPGDDTPPVESRGSYCVLRLSYRSPFDEAAYVQQADAVRARLYQRKSQEYIGYWYQELREKTEIVDLREAL